jgi:probable HAF family extracellular repeat protein
MDAAAAGPTRLVAGPDSAPPPGFLLERGRFTAVAIPRGLEDLAPQGISPLDIGDRGQIVGSYADPALAEHGFVLDRGRFATIDVPDAKGTQAQGINYRGQIVGVYSDTSNPSMTGAQLRGFLLDRGRYLRLDFPGAVTSQAFDINDQGQVVGEYQDAAGRFHGFVWEWGRFETIDVPGQAGTTATGINNRGQIPESPVPSRPRSGSCWTAGGSPPSRSPAPSSPSPTASTTRAGRGLQRHQSDRHDGRRVPAGCQGAVDRDQAAGRRLHRDV